jgi:hypothetical protein
VRSRLLGLGLALTVVGCAPASGVRDIAELAGEWRGRVSNPAGHAAAALAVTAAGAFRGTMYLDGGDRAFHGTLVVVRPGEVRYQATDGNGTVRVEGEADRRVLRFLRDDGGVEATFRR